MKWLTTIFIDAPVVLLLAVALALAASADWPEPQGHVGWHMGEN